MSAYAKFPGLQAANGCLAVGCTACCEGPGNPCLNSRGVPARKPHAARIHRTDVVARWEEFERAQAADDGAGLWEDAP